MVLQLVTLTMSQEQLPMENTPPAQPQQASPAQIEAVQVKLPPFRLKDPQLWFAQIEVQSLSPEQSLTMLWLR